VTGGKQKRDFETVDTLIIDDLGSERFNGWGLEQFQRIIDTRYQESRQIIVTSITVWKNCGKGC
jgi:DNA replication protein DnaC